MSRTLVVALLVVCGPVVLYLAWLVHCIVERITVAHARRLCEHRGLEVHRVRWGPEFEPSGLKTEYTLIQLDCSDSEGRRRLVEVLAWLFGVQKVIRDDTYPESLDGQWPMDPA